jgi:pterin-4a-carbinolamine dehydratase
VSGGGGDADHRRTYEFKDFVAAMKFVNAVANVAEKASPPDIDIRWNKVTWH